MGINRHSFKSLIRALRGRAVSVRGLATLPITLPGLFCAHLATQSDHSQTPADLPKHIETPLISSQNHLGLEISRYSLKGIWSIRTSLYNFYLRGVGGSLPNLVRKGWEIGGDGNVG